MQITMEEQKTLHILGYLYYQMGDYEKAERIFSTILIMTHKKPYDKNIFGLLAVIAISQQNGKKALEYLQNVFDETILSGKKSIYYFLKAKALWLEKRYDEAQNMLNEYLAIKGNN